MKSLSIVILILAQLSFAQAAEHRGQKKRKAKARTTVVVKGSKKATKVRVVNYRYRNLPRRGAVVTSLDRRASIIRYNNVKYRFHAGVWYKPYGAKWVVVRPVAGMRIKVLPVGYRRLVVNRNAYYYYYGSFYKKSGNAYVVVEAPVGAIIYSLPDGYRTLTVRNRRYYELDGVYYRPSVTNGKEVLVVTRNPY